jgi:hypothetical protein
MTVKQQTVTIYTCMPLASFLSQNNTTPLLLFPSSTSHTLANNKRILNPNPTLVAHQVSAPLIRTPLTFVA